VRFVVAEVTLEEIFLQTLLPFNPLFLDDNFSDSPFELEKAE
jgi:hypothetical protein